MATHSSIIACRIPWSEEPGGLQATTWMATHAIAESDTTEQLTHTGESIILMFSSASSLTLESQNRAIIPVLHEIWSIENRFILHF